MFIIIPLIVLYFSFKQPARHVKEPTRKNMIWCIILGILNVIYAIQTIVAINNPETAEMGFVFELFVIALAVLYGWLAYRNYKAIKGTVLSGENVAESSNHQENRYCNKCGKELAESSLFCDSCGAKIRGTTQSQSSVVNNGPTVSSPSPVVDSDPTIPMTDSITDLMPTRIKDKGLMYWITPGSAFIVILITLQKWIHLKILDSYNDLYSLFTGSSKKLETKYSLFQFSDILNNIN